MRRLCLLFLCLVILVPSCIMHTELRLPDGGNLPDTVNRDDAKDDAAKSDDAKNDDVKSIDAAPQEGAPTCNQDCKTDGDCSKSSACLASGELLCINLRCGTVGGTCSLETSCSSGLSACRSCPGKVGCLPKVWFPGQPKTCMTCAVLCKTDSDCNSKCGNSQFRCFTYKTTNGVSLGTCVCATSIDNSGNIGRPEWHKCTKTPECVNKCGLGYACSGGLCR